MWVPVSKGGSRSQQRTMHQIDENLQKNTRNQNKKQFKDWGSQQKFFSWIG